MSIKRYVWNACDEHSCHCDVVESADGAMVDYDDHVAVVSALAAENAALKVAIDGVHHELYGKGFEVAGWHLNGALEPLDSWFEDNNWNPETPATDAILAELRARGVDAAIAELNQLAERSEKEAPIAAEHYRSAALYLQLFAAQLRQEAK